MIDARLREQCAACNALIESGKLRVVGAAPFERYYDADHVFLGFGFERSGTHVGTGTRIPKKGGREPPREGEDVRRIG